MVQGGWEHGCAFGCFTPRIGRMNADLRTVRKVASFIFSAFSASSALGNEFSSSIRCFVSGFFGLGTRDRIIFVMFIADTQELMELGGGGAVADAEFAAIDTGVV